MLKRIKVLRQFADVVWDGWQPQFQYLGLSLYEHLHKNLALKYLDFGWAPAEREVAPEWILH